MIVAFSLVVGVGIGYGSVTCVAAIGCCSVVVMVVVLLVLLVV